MEATEEIEPIGHACHPVVRGTEFVFKKNREMDNGDAIPWESGNTVLFYPRNSVFYCLIT